MHMKFYIVITMRKLAKKIFGHNSLLEDPIDLRKTRLNHILQDFFRDTPFEH